MKSISKGDPISLKDGKVILNAKGIVFEISEDGVVGVYE